jgi:GNAT superfamily N-acetyltransferase
VTTTTAVAPFRVRLMIPQTDLVRLVALSPPERKKLADFLAYPTLVAEDLPLQSAEADTEDHAILGYCQFSLDPVSRVLTSYAIRVADKAQGRGVGRRLIRAQRQIAASAGAVLHVYHVDPSGTLPLRKILESEGLHLCQQHEAVWIYLGQLTPEDAVQGSVEDSR